MARPLRGLLVCVAWYYTILAGFYILYCPVLYLMFIKHKLYRHVVDIIFGLWELFPVALFQCGCSTQLHHYGDYIKPGEKSIIIMNHRTRVDWNYVWIALYHATQHEGDKQRDEPADKSAADNVICLLKRDVNSYRNVLNEIIESSKTKFVLKDELKAVPGLGWIMQLNFFLYVKRDWREDQTNLSQFLEYHRRVDCKYQIVLFPEGTDLSNDNRKKSDRFAEINKLPHLDFVLHPRTTGWAVLCSQLRPSGLACVYDVTVAYDAPPQTEGDLLRGKLPTHAHFCFKRYPIEDLPKEEDGLRMWLNDRWKEKEASLRMFHNSGNFYDAANKEVPHTNQPRSLTAAKMGFLFWSVVDAIFTYAMYYSLYFKCWVIYNSLLFVFVTWKFGGFQNIQYQILTLSSTAG